MHLNGQEFVLTWSYYKHLFNNQHIIADLPSLTEFPWVSRNHSWSPGLTEMLKNLTEFGQFEWYFFLSKKSLFLAYLTKTCVSTHEYHSMWWKMWFRNRREWKIPATPPPQNRVSFWRRRKISATTPHPHWSASAFGDHGKILLLPPPTESRRLLEITEKTQEIQQAQLGSSVIVWVPHSSSTLLCHLSSPPPVSPQHHAELAPERPHSVYSKYSPSTTANSSQTK